jgi:hypothetical protein
MATGHYSTRILTCGWMITLGFAIVVQTTFAQDGLEPTTPRDVLPAQRGSGVFPLLARRDVRKELKLRDDQVEAINKLDRAIPARLLELGLGSRDVTANEKRQRIMQFDEQLGSELAAILLPIQMQRLNQIERQLRVQHANLSEEMVNDEIIKALEVTADQLGQWNSMREQVDREYDRQRVAIRDQAQAQFLAKLTPDQRARWKELFGTPFLAKEQPTTMRAAATMKKREPEAK